jgi:hypothetical protein
MRRFFERRRIARALERADGEHAPEPAIERAVDAHRRVEALLRRGAPAARPVGPVGSGAVRARVLAAIEADARATDREPARTHGVHRPFFGLRRAALVAAALVLAGFAGWLAFGRHDAAPTVTGAPAAVVPDPDSEVGVAPTLAVLGELPRASTTKLREAIDQPLLGEFDKLARDTRTLGRFLRGRVPALVLRTDDDHGWR